MDEKNIKIYQATAEDFLKPEFVKVFADNGVNPPNPLTSFVLLAELEGKIIGFHVLQPVYHAEPMFVDKGFRDKNVNKMLMEAMIKVLQNVGGLQVFVFAPNIKTANFVRNYDFNELGYIVLERKF